MEEKLRREFTREQLNELRLLVRDEIQGRESAVRGLEEHRLDWASPGLQAQILEEERFRLGRARELRLALR